MIKYNIPYDFRNLEKLSVGDVFYLSGKIFTARDEAHCLLLDLPLDKIPFSTFEMALYHCGPLMKQHDGDWEVICAGPTTSSRMELFENQLIKKLGIRLIIGKGIVGEQTINGLQHQKGVYAVYTGGAGALAADQIKRVVDVFWLNELGVTEAVWVFEIEQFGPLVVGVDSRGCSLFKRY